VDQAAGRNPIRRDFDVLSILGPKYNDGWFEAEDYAAIAGILPFFFQLALAKVKGEQNQGVLFESLITVCHQVAATASNPKLWTETAELLQEFFSGKLSGDDFIEKAASFSGPHIISLQTLSLLAAACESSTEHAVYYHLEAMPNILDFFRSLGLIYEKIIVPFYKAFWATLLHENRFRFRMPNMIEQEFTQLSESTERNVIPRILTLMASGLGVAPSERVRAWLVREA
jgi:hypothetical protein